MELLSFLNNKGSQLLASKGALLGLGLLSLLGYAWLSLGFHAFSTQTQVFQFLGAMFGLFLLYFLAGLAQAKLGQQQSLWLIFAFALMFRLALLPVGLPRDAVFDGSLKGSQEVVHQRFLLYDHDIWRFLWDGFLGVNGKNPYEKTPAAWEADYWNGEPEAEALLSDDLWLDILDYVDFKEYTSVYPPVAQCFFMFTQFLAPGSVTFFKLMLIFIELTMCFYLIKLLKSNGLPQQMILLYLWNPLVIKEFSGSGHYDVLMLLFLFVSLWLLQQKKAQMAIFWFGVALITKPLPLFLLPFYLKRCRFRYWFLLFLPLLISALFYREGLWQMFEGIAVFARNWEFNAGAYAFLKWSFSGFDGVARLMVHLASLAVLFLCWKRDQDVEKVPWDLCFYAVAIPLMISPTVMPWYLCWVLPLALFAKNKAWFVLTLSSVLSYLIYIDGIEKAWWLTIEHSLFWLMFLIPWLKNVMRKGESQVQERL